MPVPKPRFSDEGACMGSAGSMPPPTDPARCSGTERPTDPISAFPCLCGATCLKKRPGVAALPSEPGYAHGGRCRLAGWAGLLPNPRLLAKVPTGSQRQSSGARPISQPSAILFPAFSLRGLCVLRAKPLLKVPRRDSAGSMPPATAMPPSPRGQCPRLQQCRRARGVNAPDCSQSNTAPAQRRPTDPACAFPFLCGSPS